MKPRLNAKMEDKRKVNARKVGLKKDKTERK